MQNHVQLFFLVMGLFFATLGLVSYHRSLSILLLCLLLVLFRTLEAMLMTFEMIKNEDTYSEEQDMMEQNTLEQETVEQDMVKQVTSVQPVNCLETRVKYCIKLEEKDRVERDRE